LLHVVVALSVVKTCN